MPERRGWSPAAAGRRPRARASLSGQLSGPLLRFVSTESGSAALLALATVLALAWANSPWSAGYERIFATEVSVRIGAAGLTMDLAHVINDALMAIFFFVIGLEVRRELSVGELTDRHRVALPLTAGLVGTIVPALLYLAINPGGDAAHGWGIVIGTDTAFMLGALAVVGPRVSTQLRIFLLTVTVIDDLIAVSVIGAVYSGPIRAGWLGVGVASLLVLSLLSRMRIWRVAPYVATALVLWLAFVEAGLHGSIAGMLAGLAIGARPPQRRSVEMAARRFQAFRQSPMATVGRSASRSLARAISPNERLQTALHPWSSFAVVPLFALANAGVDLRGGAFAEALGSPVTWGIVLALVAGKPLAIATTTLVGARRGVGQLPQGVRSGHVFGGASLSGIGFTASLLIAGLAFSDPTLQDHAVVGILLAAVLATLTGGVVFRAAAHLRGHTDADLPRALDRPVDPGVDHVQGPADAPLTLVEYADFACHFCAEATGVTRQLRERFGDDLRYVFRHLPLPDVHPDAVQAAHAAVAAERQGRFWELHDLLFAHADHLEYEHLLAYASQLGLDVERFVDDLEDETVHARVRADVVSAEASGARGAPTFFVNGRRHVGPHDAATLAAALEAARSAAHVG